MKGGKEGKYGGWGSFPKYGLETRLWLDSNNYEDVGFFQLSLARIREATTPRVDGLNICVMVVVGLVQLVLVVVVGGEE